MPDRNMDTTQEQVALVARARGGDTHAFESLVRQYRNEVYALCYYFSRNREDAWDLAQDVFIKAWHAIGRVRDNAVFKAWLMRIAANHCKDYLKKRRLSTIAYDDAVQTPETESGQAPDAALAARELGRAIDDAVQQLPPKQQMAFVLREYQGLSYQEMAEVMQCGMGTVMSRLFNARRKLQQMLTAQGIKEIYQ